MISASTATALPAGNIKGRPRESRLDASKRLRPSLLPVVPGAAVAPMEKPALLPGQMGRNGNVKSPRFAAQAPVPAGTSRQLHVNISDCFSNKDLAEEGGGSETQHRALRLRSSQESADTFSFLPELVSERGRLRVREFVASYQSLGPSMKAQVDALNKQLQPFGYSLFHWQMKASNVSSVFQKWEVGRASA